MQTMLGKAANTDWFGPLAGVIVAVVVIGAVEPTFLSAFNIQVLLSAIAVNLVIALAQMIIIAIGQMNLSVGAIGGLVAIAFAGTMAIGAAARQYFLRGGSIEDAKRAFADKSWRG